MIIIIMMSERQERTLCDYEACNANVAEPSFAITEVSDCGH